MLVVHVADAHAGPFPDEALARSGTDALRAFLHGQALGPHIEDDAFRRGAAHHGGEHGGGASFLRSDDIGLRSVHENVRARAQFGDARHYGQAVQQRGGRAEAHRFGLHAAFFRKAGKVNGALHGRRGDGVAGLDVRRGIAVAVMREEAAQAHVRAGGDAVQKGVEVPFLDDARALLAHFDLDGDLRRDGGPGKDLLRGFHLFRAVHAENDVDALFGKGADAAQFAFAHDLVGDEDVAQAVFGHDFGLAYLGNGNACRAHFRLHQCDGGHFVGLGMRAQGHALRVGVVLHEAQVAFKDVAVDEQGRGVEFGVFHTASVRLL